MAYYSDSYHTTTSTYDDSTLSAATSSTISSAEPTATSSTLTTLSTSSTTSISSTVTDLPTSSASIASSSTSTAASSLETSAALPSPIATESRSLPVGAKAAIGAAIGVILIFAILIFFWFRSRRRQRNNVGLLRGKSILASPMSRSPPSVAYVNTNPEPFRHTTAPAPAPETAYNAGPLALSSALSSPHAISRSMPPQPQELPLSAQPTPATAYGGHAFATPATQSHGYAQGLPRTVTPPPPFHPAWHEPR